MRATTSAFVSHTKGFATLTGCIKSLGKNPPEPCKRLRMGGPGCSRANNLSHRRKIQAHHPVFEELDVIEPEQTGCYSPQGREQKGARPVRRLLAQLLIKVRPDRDVNGAV